VPTSRIKHPFRGDTVAAIGYMIATVPLAPILRCAQSGSSNLL
jgi:hypothetical protein